MAVRKINNSWYVDITHRRKRDRKKSPENSKAGAQAYEALLRQKLARGEPIDGEDNKREECQQKFKLFAWEWFETYVKTNNKASEIDNKMYALQSSLVPFFGEIPLNKIETFHVEQYKAQKTKEGLSNCTVNHYLTILRTCLRHAEDWVHLEKLPKIKKLKLPPDEFDFLSFEESDMLLKHAHGMWEDIILTALKTGMRLGELRGLRWPDVNWNNNTFTVRHSWCDHAKALVTPKGNKVRYIPIVNELHGVLLQKKLSTGFVFPGEKGNRFNGPRLNREIGDACTKTGIRKITCQVLRHTFASHLVMKGAPLKAIQELMGHEDIQTTMRYAHLTPSSLKASIDLLQPSSGRLSEDVGQYTVNKEQPTVMVQ